MIDFEKEFEQPLGLAQKESRLATTFKVAYGWMALGLALSGVVAWYTAMSGLYQKVLAGPGFIGCIVAELALVENLQREDLDPIEEALGFKELSDKFGYTQEDISKLIGCSRPAVANALRLVSLPSSVRKMVSSRQITAGHARALLMVEDEKLMKKLADIVVKEDLSVRDTERLARNASKPSSRSGKKTKKRNPYYDEVELALSDVLGRKVKVTRSSKKGSLEIEFFDDDDLKKLLKIFDNE